MTTQTVCSHKAGRVLALGLICLAGLLPLAADAAQPVRGGSLTYAIPGNPDTLDPQMTTGTLTFQHLKSVYDTLVEPDADGHLIPALAESWAFSTEDKTLTFHLRPGVRFHNGDPLTAADVQATFERILAPDSASPHQPRFAAVEDIRIIDDLTVQFVLNKVAVPLLATLGSGWSAILPKRAIEADHDFSAHPLGTGPFQFQEWVRDDHVTYTRFPDYWIEGQPYLEQVEFKVVVEPTIQLQGLLVGEFDIIHVLEPHNVPKIERQPETEVFTHPTGLALVVAMNHVRPPLDNLLVRRALCHAIDRQAVLDIAYTGGVVIGAFIDAGSPYYTDYSDMYPYDPAEARRLLAEAGYPDGFNVTLTLPQNYSQHVNAGNMVQNMLQQVGIQATIELVDWGTWISQVYRGKDYDLTIIGHTGHLDPDGRLSSELGYTNYTNPELFRLIEQAAVTPDPDQRMALYADVQRIMAEDAVMVFLGTMNGLRGIRSTVHGFRMTYALDTPDFRETYKTAEP
jgi:peptide/nickel transport system substrate-binding protein